MPSDHGMLLILKAFEMDALSQNLFSNKVTAVLIMQFDKLKGNREKVHLDFTPPHPVTHTQPNPKNY